MSSVQRYFTRSLDVLDDIGETTSQHPGDKENADTTPRQLDPHTLDIFRHSKQDGELRPYNEFPLRTSQKFQHVADSHTDTQLYETNNKEYTWDKNDVLVPPRGREYSRGRDDPLAPPHLQRPHFHRASIGEWEFQEMLGQGSMGKVKLAKSSTTGEFVAVKVVTRALKTFLAAQRDIPSPRTKEELAKREKSLMREVARDTRTVREAALGRILDHPNVCRMYDLYTLSHHYYMTFEYVSGGQLLDYIIQNGLISENKSRKFARSIGSVLSYLHKNNIVHRDLKIENIMIDSHGELKLIDFGLSNFYNLRSLLETYCGSLYFAAPELLSATPYIGPEIDVWSFGVVIYVLVCGRIPFDDDDANALHAKIRSGKFTFPEFVSSDARSLIKKMLTVEPADRATLPQVLKHRWMNKNYVCPPMTHFPDRTPLTVDTIDQNVIEEMVKLELVKDAETTMLELQNIVISKKYTSLSKGYYKVKKSIRQHEVLDGNVPTTAYHPLLSKYYLTSEWLQRGHKHNSSLDFDNSPSSQTVVNDDSQDFLGNEPHHDAPHSIISSVHNPNADESKYNNLPFKIKKTSDPHVSPTRKTHHNPSDDIPPMSRKQSVPVTTRDYSSSNKGPLITASKVKKVFRRLSTTIRSSMGSNSRKTTGSTSSNEPAKPVSPTEDFAEHLPNVIERDVSASPPWLKAGNKAMVRSKSVGNERQYQTMLLKRDTVENKQETGNDNDTESQNSSHAHGIFSVQTTSSRSRRVVRSKIIKALEKNHIQYTEYKNGFHCSYLNKIPVVNTNILQDEKLTSDDNDYIDNTSNEGPRNEVYLDTDDNYMEESLNHTSDTIHESLPQLLYDDSPSSKETGTHGFNTPLTPASRVTTNNNPLTLESNIVTKIEPESMLSSPITNNIEWNKNQPYIAHEGRQIIEFDISITKLSILGLIGVHLNKIRGDSWAYKDVATRLIESMNL
ncbi:hypothetical protein DAKH74_021880 [Maudiozyma humilis]|uniref:non-specific serine/threonine protein kinase n=1 Tax=Maudiozyma humilis TaxID=51915 RepID=A0AAV5RWT3_MAUHU|nr:hypothetical protein DAKH74_021880 [Kazachstania humilis]